MAKEAFKTDVKFNIEQITNIDHCIVHVWDGLPDVRDGHEGQWMTCTLRGIE